MKLFIGIELLVFLLFIYQLSTNVFLLMILFIGIFLLFQGNTRPGKSGQKKFGLLFILFAVLSTQAAWLMLIIGVIFIASPYFTKNKEDNNEKVWNPPWKKKEFFSPETLQTQPKTTHLQQMTWFGRDDIGKNAYEWEDINFTKLMGETVIDLGNTILPNKENTIIIRKGFGNTRILIPPEAGVTVNYSTLFGKYKREQEEIILKNERVQQTEKNYDEKPRKLHIIVNVLIGELEVIHL